MRDTETIIESAIRCGTAYRRGYERGQSDEQANYYNDAPLSGEWAGESVSDLLGDLIDDAETVWETDNYSGDSSAAYWFARAAYVGQVTDILSTYYENGYMAAFSRRSLCDVCNGLVTEAHAVRDNDVVYCSLSCSGDLG